jgi:hypothetical protein
VSGTLGDFEGLLEVARPLEVVAIVHDRDETGRLVVKVGCSFLSSAQRFIEKGVVQWPV